MSWKIQSLQKLPGAVERIELSIAFRFHVAKTDDAVQDARNVRSVWKDFLAEADLLSRRTDDPKGFLSPLRENGIIIPNCYEFHYKPYTLVYRRYEDTKTAVAAAFFEEKDRENELTKLIIYLNGIT